MRAIFASMFDAVGKFPSPVAMIVNKSPYTSASNMPSRMGNVAENATKHRDLPHPAKQ
jgi:hypothetical protein